MLAALRLCPAPGCPTLTRGGKCDVHRKALQQQDTQRRGTAQERGYDYRWSQLSAKWKRTHPFCGMRADMQLHPDHSRCVQHGRMNNEDLVTDHILAKKDGGTDEESNLQTLCQDCNKWKAIQFEGGFGR